MLQFTFKIATLLSLVSFAYSATITVNNNCPAMIQVFLDGVNSAIISPGATTRFINVPQSSLSQLSLSPTPNSGTIANIFFPFGYYYVTQDSFNFNAGVSISPDNQSANNGFCGVARCDNNGCSDAFSSQPQITGPSPSVPPDLPLHACSYVTNFTVTWCPDGTMPLQPTFACNEIHPIGDSTLCLAVRNYPPTYGTPVDLFTCTGSPSQGWVLQRGSTTVKLARTNFCLDAGNITNMNPVKVWPCLSVPQQTWDYQQDSQLAVTIPPGSGGPQQCLDVTAGLLSNGNPLQTYFCTPASVNQIFTVTSCR